MVPWGYVCGYPTANGDLYGGSHYSQLCSSNLTLQGKSMQEAAMKFGDGKTLPFTPCKKGYNPYHDDGHPMYACPLHDKARRRRVMKGEGKFRKGEVALDILFWRIQLPSEKS